MQLEHQHQQQPTQIHRRKDRGNWVSRVSHSCEPNCATEVAIVDSTIGPDGASRWNTQFVCKVDDTHSFVSRTIRDVVPGEELTQDYHCVTSSEEEFKMAICLCGKTKCRGAFLGYSETMRCRVFYTRSTDPWNDLLRYVIPPHVGTVARTRMSQTERRNVRRRPRLLLLPSLFRVVRRVLVTSLKYFEYHRTTH